ncbi:MAG: conjugal transfer protein TraO [Algibacter sp.]
MKNKSHRNQRFVLLLFISMSYYAQSQNHATAIELLGGYSYRGIGFLANYNYHISGNQMVQGGVYFSYNSAEVKDNIEVPYNTFNVNIGYITNIYTSIRKTTKINAGGGGLLGYEEVNNGNILLENGALVLEQSKFIYGGFAFVELDFYINNDIGLILKLNEYYHVNSDLGKLSLFAGVGMRYFFF